MGTVAITDPPFVKEMCEKFPGRIAIGLDTKNEFVATEGWAKESKINFCVFNRYQYALIIFSIGSANNEKPSKISVIRGS